MRATLGTWAFGSMATRVAALPARSRCIDSVDVDVAGAQAPTAAETGATRELAFAALGA
jgi:hypothetical protein